MSKKAHIEEPEHHGAPRWYVGFSTLTTILMTFFITLTVSMGDRQDMGYAGPGSGAFREAFNAHGMPGVLRGARRVLNLFTWGEKYLPEEIALDAASETVADRVIEMPEPDLKQLVAQSVKASDDIVLPLPLRYETEITGADRDRLSAAARMLRQSDRNILISATLPSEANTTTETLCRASEWSLNIARHLSAVENIDAARIMAVGNIACASSKGRVAEPAVTLVLRPKTITPQAAVPKPRTEYEIVHAQQHKQN